MLEKLQGWQELIENKWWGGLAVYVATSLSSYFGIWAIIEPLSIPDRIAFWGNSLDRWVIHLVSSIVIGAHLTLMLDFFCRWRRSALPNSIDSSSVSQSLELTNLLDKETLLYYRILYKDEKISCQVFASLVVLAVNSNVVSKDFATELLRGTGLKVHSLDDRKIYGLVSEEVT